MIFPIVLFVQRSACTNPLLWPCLCTGKLGRRMAHSCIISFAHEFNLHSNKSHTSCWRMKIAIHSTCMGGARSRYFSSARTSK